MTCGSFSVWIETVMQRCLSTNGDVRLKKMSNRTYIVMLRAHQPRGVLPFDSLPQKSPRQATKQASSPLRTLCTQPHTYATFGTAPRLHFTQKRRTMGVAQSRLKEMKGFSLCMRLREIQADILNHYNTFHPESKSETLDLLDCVHSWTGAW